MTDWYARCAYDPEVKQRFHTAARARLRRLATTLGFRPDRSISVRTSAGSPLCGMQADRQVREVEDDSAEMRVWKLIHRYCWPMCATCPMQLSG